MEAAWRVVDPILHDPLPVVQYEPGTWGPAAANGVLAATEQWHDPKAAEPSPC